MQRWKIIIEYEGSQFNGWQSQKDGSGIQDNLEKAIKNYSKEDIKTFSLIVVFAPMIVLFPIDTFSLITTLS